MRTYIFILFLAVVVALSSFGADYEATLGAVVLEDGDSFVFIGDSITHQCLYTQYVEDYFYTRHPDKRIRFHNAGVSGDQAVDVLRRFDDDIASFKPKYASILIGMNDGHYTPFEDEIFNRYKEDMTETLDRLEAINTTAIVMTPTIYDLRQALRGDNGVDEESARQMHYNATLSFFGMWGLQQANARVLGFVDMFGPLNRATRAGRVADPDFTLIRDGVHPGADGQVVMALAVLEDIGASSLVSSIHLSKENRRWVAEVENGTLRDLGKKEVSFTFTAKSLPWVVPEEASSGYSLTDAGSRMSREAFRVTGLKAGNYALFIDGKTVGTYTHVALAAGIELQGNDQTPQYAQALAVAMLNKEKNEEAVNPLRDLWSGMKGAWYQQNERGEGEEEDEEGERNRRARFDEWTAEFPGKVDKLLEKVREYDDKIYASNTPKSHEYRLASVN